MILTDLAINVVFLQREQVFAQVIPGIEAQFTLQCLVCGHIHQLSSPQAYKLKAGTPPYQYIHAIKTVIQQTRSCTNCGILSTLPKLDSSKLEKVLQRTITQEFIDQHSQDQAPFLAQRLLDRMLSHRS